MREIRQGMQVHNSVSVEFTKNRLYLFFFVQQSNARPIMSIHHFLHFNLPWPRLSFSYNPFNVLMFFVDFAINVPVQSHLLTIRRRLLHH